MNDSNEEQLDINAGRAKSIEVVQATKSDPSVGSTHPTTPFTPRKGWPLLSLIVLMPLGAIGVILYLLRHALAAEFEGFGAAFTDSAAMEGVAVAENSFAASGKGGPVSHRSSEQRDVAGFVYLATDARNRTVCRDVMSVRSR